MMPENNEHAQRDETSYYRLQDLSTSIQMFVGFNFANKNESIIQKEINNYIEHPKELNAFKYSLACCLWNDRDNLERNKAKIQGLLKESSDAGFTLAMVEYAKLHFFREFPMLSPEDGIDLLNRAKEHGEEYAIFLLGMKFLHGCKKPRYAEIPQDYAKALSLFQDYYQTDVSVIYLTEILSRMQEKEIEYNEGMKLIGYFQDLKKAIADISTKHHVDVKAKDKLFAHYTSLKTLQNIFPMKHDPTDASFPYLALSHLASMDDPFEGKALVASNDDSLLNYFFDALSLNDKIEEESAFCISFSDKVDNLDLWRLYSRGNNYSICFVFEPTISGWTRQLKEHSASDSGYFQQVTRTKQPSREFDNWRYIKKIIYSIEKTVNTSKTISKYLKPIKQFCIDFQNKTQVDTVPIKDKQLPLVKAIHRCVRVLLYEIIYLYKKEAYAQESEYRISALKSYTDNNVGVLSDNVDGRPHRLFYKKGLWLGEMTLSRIIISPAISDKLAVIADIKCRLAKHGLSSVKVCESDQPSVAQI